VLTLNVVASATAAPARVRTGTSTASGSNRPRPCRKMSAIPRLVTPAGLKPSRIPYSKTHQTRVPAQGESTA
jgi:hypothetical protein